jgi:hypothetical protein
MVCKSTALTASSAHVIFHILTVASAAPDAKMLPALATPAKQLIELVCPFKVATFSNSNGKLGFALHRQMVLSAEALASKGFLPRDVGRNLTAFTVSVWPARNVRTPKWVSLYLRNQ